MALADGVRLEQPLGRSAVATAEVLLASGAHAGAVDPATGRTALGRLYARAAIVDDERATLSLPRVGVPAALQELLATGGETAADAAARRRASGVALADVRARLWELADYGLQERAPSPGWRCACRRPPGRGGAAGAPVFAAVGDGAPLDAPRCLRCVADLLGAHVEDECPF